MEKIIYKPGAEELWDAHSEHIGEDIDGLQMIAGTSMMRRFEFMKAVDGLQSENERLREVLEKIANPDRSQFNGPHELIGGLIETAKIALG